VPMIAICMAVPRFLRRARRTAAWMAHH